MVHSELYKNGHITALSFLRLESEQLNASQRQSVSAHLANCEDCMERYIESLTEEHLVAPPKALEQNIIRLVSSQGSKNQGKKILIIQFAKLAVAVSLTMVILMSGVFEIIGTAPISIMNSAWENAQKSPAAQTEVIKKEKQQNDLFFDVTQGFRNGFNAFAFRFNNGNKK